MAPFTTIIDGSALDRVLHILASNTVEITGLTIHNGNASGVTFPLGHGGGIFNSGTLTLRGPRRPPDGPYGLSFAILESGRDEIPL